ncbi:hypothetical protein GWI33_011570 [Rhynchophorus ferrugineus]|uniref:Uncharacterized protein n=1 Tax=Rhynchophorus ferrugineus TaxID=354439 RepID=A0A834IAS2_RHYFE|nr:hypothetical protein GWI33_011570 [Rhynchophorus ferrugineus]
METQESYLLLISARLASLLADIVPNGTDNFSRMDFRCRRPFLFTHNDDIQWAAQRTDDDREREAAVAAVVEASGKTNKKKKTIGIA